MTYNPPTQQMPRDPWLVAALLASLLTAPLCAASAQTSNGVLMGSVKDEQGAVLPGVTIRISSAALLGGFGRISKRI